MLQNWWNRSAIKSERLFDSLAKLLWVMGKSGSTGGGMEVPLGKKSISVRIIGLKGGVLFQQGENIVCTTFVEVNLVKWSRLSTSNKESSKSQTSSWDATIRCQVALVDINRLIACYPTCKMPNLGH